MREDVSFRICPKWLETGLVGGRFSLGPRLVVCHGFYLAGITTRLLSYSPYLLRIHAKNRYLYGDKESIFDSLLNRYVWF